MEIRIVLEDTDPPVGSVSVIASPSGDDAAPAGLPFVGWLELMRVLSAVTGQPPLFLVNGGPA